MEENVVKKTAKLGKKAIIVIVGACVAVVSAIVGGVACLIKRRKSNKNSVQEVEVQNEETK